MKHKVAPPAYAEKGLVELCTPAAAALASPRFAGSRGGGLSAAGHPCGRMPDGN